MPRLIEKFRQTIEAKHYSRRTLRTYESWIRRYIKYHRNRHPKEMGGEEVTQFLTHLATEKKVASSTQNQALSALLFLYKEVLDMELPWMDDIVRAKRPVRVPVVLSVREVEMVLDRMHGPSWLVASMLYGAGLRLLEALRMRVQDVDFDAGELVVRRGKGQKDRRTMLPRRIVRPLKAHLERVHRQHKADLASDHGYVEIPSALVHK